MKHHFITCYFNYCEYESRRRLTQDFLDRYPQVHCIEYAYGDKPFVLVSDNITRIRLPKFTGFMNNVAINWYICKFRDTIKSLTFIDSDLELQSHFFGSIELKVDMYFENEPLFIQGCSSITEVYPEKYKLGIPMKSAGYCAVELKDFDFKSHTGCVYTYNKAFIDSLGPKLFPECLVLGGFDTILWMSLFSMKFKIQKFIQNENIVNELMDFYERVQGCDVDYICGNINHYYHGDKSKRYSNRSYQELSDKVVEDYFASRLEDCFCC